MEYRQHIVVGFLCWIFIRSFDWHIDYFDGDVVSKKSVFQIISECPCGTCTHRLLELCAPICSSCNETDWLNYQKDNAAISLDTLTYREPFSFDKVT
jgi:hypothetical protein